MDIATNKFPFITVVIVNYNRCDDLRQALLSFARQDYASIETIVVDNASTDGSAGMLSTEFTGVRVIKLDRNVGMKGSTVGSKAASGELIFQMDNDSEMPDNNVLSQVVAAFNAGVETLATGATRVEESRGSGETFEQLRVRDSRTGYHKTYKYRAGSVGFRKSLMDQVFYYNQDVL